MQVREPLLSYLLFFTLKKDKPLLVTNGLLNNASEMVKRLLLTKRFMYQAFLGMQSSAIFVDFIKLNKKNIFIKNPFLFIINIL